MIASSVWSLLIPSIQRSIELKIIAWLPCAIGVLFGGLFLLFIMKITKKKSLFIAVTMHNIPEGMAVGLAFGCAYFAGSSEQIILAFGLALGIGIQNIPEGMALSLPYALTYKSKTKGFLMGALSGAVEPIFAVLAFFLASYLLIVMPWLLAFSAGAMLYVTVVEILPEAYDKENNLLAFSFLIGFLIMMIMDVALG